MNRSSKRDYPYALKPGEGWIYRFGIDFNIKAREIQQGRGAAIIEYSTKKGKEPPSHTHETEDEMFYVLEGAITFRCGSETFDLEKGGFVFLPHGIEHAYTIQNGDTVRLLVITSPVRARISGGWKGFVANLELGQGELIAKPEHMD